MKKVIIVIIIAVIGVGIYYTGIYTYFQEDMVDEKIPEFVSDPEPTTTPDGETPAPTPTPQINTVKQGNFVDADFIHKGSGQASVLEYPDGRKILRFENFETINGPDLFVYLSETQNPGGNVNSLGSYIDLGRLKGNKGNQNYELPDGINIDSFGSVVIWCKQFSVLFPYAILE
ncbi:MAG: DM13 domain-containing protein [Candidatus Paceibacterota bacterium]